MGADGETGFRHAAHLEPPMGLSPCDRGLAHGWGPEPRTVLIGRCVGVREMRLISMPVLGHPLSPRRGSGARVYQQEDSTRFLGVCTHNREACLVNNCVGCGEEGI